MKMSLPEASRPTIWESPKTGGPRSAKEIQRQLPQAKSSKIMLIYYNFSTFLKRSILYPEQSVFWVTYFIFMVVRSHRPSFRNFHKIFRVGKKKQPRFFMIFPQAKSSKKSHHFLVFFAKIPFPRPPCLSALPYGKITFNLYLQK